MSDKYVIDGVTVSPTGGGWYELSLPDQDVVRVQGKENADAKAVELGAAAKAAGGDEGDNGSMGAQPPLAEVVNGKVPSDDEATKAKDDQIAALQAQLAERDASIEAFAAAAQNTSTVLEQQAPVIEPGVPAAIPRRFAGEMSAGAKKLLASKGLTVSWIVLEESTDIPPTGLFVSHNGTAYVIVPGEEVEVPDFLLEVLDNAITSAAQTDGTTGKIVGHRNRSRFPYRRIGDKK